MELQSEDGEGRGWRGHSAAASMEMGSACRGCQHSTEEGAGTGVALCPVLGDRQDRDVSTPQGKRTAVE